MDKLKYIKIEDQDGTISDNIPIGADAENIDMANGNNLETELVNINQDLNNKNISIYNLQNRDTELNEKINNNAIDLQNKISNLDEKNSINNNNLQIQINSLASGSPKGTYVTEEALKEDNPETGVYIVTADGHIYSWTKDQIENPFDLGIYQAVGIGEDSINYNHLESDLKSVFDIKENYNNLILNDLEEKVEDNLTYKIKNNILYINGTVNNYKSIVLDSTLNIINKKTEIYIMNQLINGSVTYDNANFSIYNEETRLTHIKVATDKNIYGTKTTEEKITKITLDCNNATFTNAQFKLWVNYEGESCFEDPLGDLTISKNAISDYNLNILDDFEDVYEEIIAEFTLNKYQNYYGNIGTYNNYRTTIIDVMPYEKYYIKGKRSGNIRNIFILDKNNNIIYQNPRITTYIQSVEDYEAYVKIPKNGIKMYINSLNINPIIKKRVSSIYKGSDVSNNDYNFIKKSYEENVINEQLKNDFAWKIPEKLYISFTFDDSNTDIDLIEDLFEQKGVPCCFATIPSKLNNICTNGETVKEVLQRAVANGGEVLSHWGTPLTNASTDEDYEEVYITAKKILTEAGFNINGIITAGGTGYDTQNFNKAIEFARPYYRFGDLTAYTGIIGRKPMQYMNYRLFIDPDNSINKERIDTFASTGELWSPYNLIYGKEHWLILASHGANDNITIPILSELIDHIKTKSNVEIVSMTTAFEMGRSTLLEERINALEN